MLIDNKNELIEGQETTIYQYLDNNILKTVNWILLLDILQFLPFQNYSIK